MNAVLLAVFSSIGVVLMGSFFVDMPYTNIEAAKQVCEGAKSSVASLDWVSVTCTNHGVFPYEVK